MKPLRDRIGTPRIEWARPIPGRPEAPKHLISDADLTPAVMTALDNAGFETLEDVRKLGSDKDIAAQLVTLPKVGPAGAKAVLAAIENIPEDDRPTVTIPLDQFEEILQDVADAAFTFSDVSRGRDGMIVMRPGPAEIDGRRFFVLRFTCSSYVTRCQTLTKRDRRFHRMAPLNRNDGGIQRYSGD